MSVIVSLPLVAYELRQNRIVAEQAAYQAFADGFREFDQLIASDSVLASLIGRVQPEHLSEEENVRLSFLYGRLLRQWEGLFRSVRTGILLEEDLAIVGGGGAFANPYFRASWPAIRPSLCEDFAVFLEGQTLLIE